MATASETHDVMEKIKRHAKSNAKTAERESVEIPKDVEQRFMDAVQHYAESQGLSLNEERVQKYADSLRRDGGSFSRLRLAKFKH